MSGDDFDDEPEGGAGVVAMVLPFATAIAALTLGSLLGFGFGYMVRSPTEVQVEVARDLTAAELAEVCAPAVEETVTELEEAQGKVQILEKEVGARERRVSELEAEISRRNQRGSSIVRELEQAKADLAEAKEQLEIALQEKERLIVELTQTKEQLAVTEEKLVEQTEMTVRAKEDALVNKWYRFINDSQLEICEKGNRKKLGRCRETVQETLMTDVRRAKFAHCVRSAQASPTVHELEKKATMPDFSQMIDEEQKQTKGWYVLFCDPTLPEQDGFFDEEHILR